jgi:hypothetical protein
MSMNSVENWANKPLRSMVPISVIEPICYTTPCMPEQSGEAPQLIAPNETEQLVRPSHDPTQEATTNAPREELPPLDNTQQFAADVMRISQEDRNTPQARELINQYASLWKIRTNFIEAAKDSANPHQKIYRDIADMLTATAQVMQTERVVQQFPNSPHEAQATTVQSTAEEIKVLLAPVLSPFGIELIQPIDASPSPKPLPSSSPPSAGK